VGRRLRDHRICGSTLIETDGWQVHIAGPSEIGWRIINVVPSQEQFEAFARDRLFPAAQQAENVTPQLTFFPVYRVIRGN
jgi:hypothetical protein